MGPGLFPVIIRNYLQNTPPADDEEQLPKLLIENKEAKIEFLKWSENHSVLVAQNPRLLKILHLAADPSNKMEHQAASVNSLVQFYFNENMLMNVEGDYVPVSDEQTLDIITEVLNNPQYEINKFPPQYAPMALDLLEAGSISFEQLIQLFSKLDSGGKLVLENRENLKSALPILEDQMFRELENLTSKVFEDQAFGNFITLLSIRNIPSNRRTILHDLECFEILMPLMHKCFNSKCVVSLLTNMNGSGDTPLHHPLIFKKSIPLLKKLNWQDHYNLFSMKNSPLHNPLILKMAIEFLEDMPQNNRDFLLNMENNDQLKVSQKLQPADVVGFRDNRGSTPLHYISFESSLGALNELPPEALFRVLIKRNPEGFTPLYTSALASYIPLLDKLSAREVCYLISIQDGTGKTLLHYDKTFNLLLPFLGKLSVEDLERMLSTLDKGGYTPLHYPDIFKSSLPLLEKLYKQDQIGFTEVFFKVMTNRNSQGYTPFQMSAVTPLFISSLLGKLSTKDACNLISIQDSQGRTLLHYNDTFNLLLPFLGKLSMEGLESMLSTLDKDGKTPLHYSGIFEASLPLLQTLNADLIFKILTLRDSQGTAALTSGTNLAAFISQLDNFEPTLVVRILSRGYKSFTFMHDHETFKSVLPYLQTKDENLVIQFLSIKDENQGIIPLLFADYFIQALPLLLKLSNDGINELFMIQSNDGTTLLHNQIILEQLDKHVELYEKLRPEVFQLRNYIGMTALEWYKLKSSQVWLEKDKRSTNLKPLSEAEYQEKSLLLKQNLDAMWKSLVFGEEEWEVPNHYLELVIAGQKKNFSPADVQNALNVIVDKITAKTPWLGTPSEGDRAGLHSFYSQMLTNFEQLMAGLSLKGDPREKAGPLINIAKFELEGRCAAAYQSEIEQNIMMLDLNANTEEGGLEAKFNKLATAALLELIENIVRKKFRGDVHVYNQMRFATGLAPYGDPLTNMAPLDCLNEINPSWNKGSLLLSLTPMIRRLGVDELQYWFELLAPEDFGHDFHVKKAELEQSEKMIMDDVKAQLQQKGLGEVQIKSCMDIFGSTQGAALRLGSPARKYVSSVVFNKMQQAMNGEELQEVQDLFAQENENDRQRKLELLDLADSLKKEIKDLQVTLKKLGFGKGESVSRIKRDLKKFKDDLKECIEERKSLQDKSIGVMREFNSLKLMVQNKTELAELFRQVNPSTSNKELEAIFSVKQEFDKRIAALAVDKEVDFVPRESGLPSRGVERARRIEYAHQFFTPNKEERLELNPKGTLEILLRIGVLEQQA